MDKQHKAIPGSLRPAVGAESTDVCRLTAKSVLSLPSSADASLEALLTLEDRQPAASSKEYKDVARQELAFAQAFNILLPGEPQQAIHWLEKTVCHLLNVRACLICLDAELPEWSGEERPLVSEGSQIGRVMISEKMDGAPLTHTDRVSFDLLLPYLTTQVCQLQARIRLLNEAQYHGDQQSRLTLMLTLAEKLLTAIDADSIFPIALETAFRQLGFDACQYVMLEGDESYEELPADAKALRGELLYEIKACGGVQANRVHSYSHAGLEGKRRVIRGYADLLEKIRELKGSQTYLYLSQSMASSSAHSLSRMFGIRGVQSALVLPVMDLACGEIRGTLNFLRFESEPIQTPVLEAAADIAKLASRAFSRALILEKALEMASSDELTGLMNRRGYYQRFESEIERARRHQIPLCVALLDVDHFKIFNDTYGHLSGDLILKTLSDLFRRNMRKSDVICRFGGEEFAILLPDTSLRSATDLIDRLRQSVERLEIPDFTGEKLKVTISAGLAQVNTKPATGPHDTDMSKALADADEQLYCAKNTGRNRVCAPENPSVIVSISSAS